MTLKEAVSKIKNFVSKSEVTVVLLIGNLGAGKTYFTNEFAQKIGIVKRLPSPTFSFLQEYSCDWEDKKRIIHCDFYRIEPEIAEKTLEQIGFWDYLDSKHIIFIEWPEKVGGLLDEVPSITINITLKENGERDYEIN